MDHDLCQKFLVATRHVVRKHGHGIDTGWGVTHTSDRRYWLVQDANGKTMFEGDACCAYAARTEGLMKLGIDAEEVKESPSFKRVTA
jgi:hypothetical protein